MTMEAEQDINQQRFSNAQEAGVPALYFNGFANALTNGDVVTVLEVNGQPIATLNMSFTMAKTLAVSLAQVISELENATKRDILTTHEIAKSLGEPETRQ